MKKKLAIISHVADLDGLMSGQIVYERFKNEYEIKCWPHDYSFDHNLLISQIEEFEPELVIMCDLSLPAEHMHKLNDLYEFVWIDHHKSAIEEFLDQFAGVQVVGTAACELAWEWCWKGTSKKCPITVELLGKYDVWNKSCEYDWENETLPFQYYCKYRCATFPDKFLKDLLHLRGLGECYDLIEKGFAALEFQQRKCAALAKAFHFKASDKLYKIIAINSSERGSMALESVFDPEEHDAMCCFFFDGYTGKWVHSWYTTKDDVDCSKIAKFFGGGGHAKAAGAQLSSPIYV